MFKRTGQDMYPELMRQAKKYSGHAKHNYSGKGKPAKTKPYCTKPK